VNGIEQATAWRESRPDNYRPPVVNCGVFPDKVIQNYQAQYLLGSGGMGEVWAGRHLYMDRRVAIKALHPSLVSNAEVRQRFKFEAVTLSGLTHPNIVRLYDYIEEPGGVYLVMEYVDGDPLDRLIQHKTGPIPEPRARALFVQMLEGLHYAHARGIVHRDIKPSNFMVTPDGRLKILDFGIAKALEGGIGQRTKTGSRIGTVLYMSPEQVKGQPIDQRSDIYSLGVTFFQMLTGQCPYPASATEYDVYQRIVSEPLPRAASIYPAVSDALQQVIDMATRKDPAARFQDCLQVLAALQGQPTESRAGTPPAPAPVPPPRRRGRLHWSVKLLIWLVLLGGAGFAAYWWRWELLDAFSPPPQEVARDFLTAIEQRRETTAKELADEGCRTQLDLLFQTEYVGRRRKVIIGRVLQQGMEAQVDYRLDGETSNTLVLHRRLLGWEVSCQKAVWMQ
jgi:serine/threonine protein kinase